MKTIAWTAGALVATLLATTAQAATPAQTCRSAKNKEAGNYADCLQKAEAKYALKGDPSARAMALQRCAAKLAAKWLQIESRLGATCPSTGDQTVIQDHLSAASADVAAAFSGEPIAGQARPLQTGQTRCWNASGQQISCTGSGQDGELRSGADRRYVDNGDGTITDATTGLMWEKLSDDTGIHDKDNVYTWVNAFNYKIAILNQEGFAGHRDWRVPNIRELQSIVDYGKVGPAVAAAFNTGCVEWCTVLTCSCTLGANTYSFWSSTAFRPNASSIMSIFFYNGLVDRTTGATQAFHVRAVRGGA